jgi:cytochrome c
MPSLTSLTAGTLVTIGILLAAACTATPQVASDAASIEAGHDLARAYCARCHGIGRADESPFDAAPPFRRIHQRYPIEQLAEALAEGIVVGHVEMPAFELQPAEIAALLAYLKSLERAAPLSGPGAG